MLGSLLGFDCRQQSSACNFPVLRLGAGVLGGHTDSGRLVPQCHRSRNFVDVLTSGAAGPGENFFELVLINPQPRQSLVQRHYFL